MHLRGTGAFETVAVCRPFGACASKMLNDVRVHSSERKAEVRNNKDRKMRKLISRMGGLWLALLAAVVCLCPIGSHAQLTATNAVSLIEENVTNARETLVPIAIGGTVLFIAIAAALKFWKKVFK